MFILQESTTPAIQKSLEANKIQASGRKKFNDHFRNQLSAVIQQSEAEIGQIRDADDKLQVSSYKFHKGFKKGFEIDKYLKSI